MAETAITPQEAAQVLHGLRSVRTDINNRAAGLSLMMWALVITSMAGNLVSYAMIQMYDDAAGDGPGWELFMLSMAAIILFWAALGALVQRIIWRSFVTPTERTSPWRAPLVAVAAVFGSILLNGFMQGLTRDLQGIGTTPDQYDELHHNLGFATALILGGAVFLAITLLQPQGTWSRRAGVTIAVGIMMLGHAGTFLWFPDLGWSGVVIGALALPFGLVSYGLVLWRKG